MPPSLSNIPYELLCYIMRGLNLEDIANLALTCTFFQHLQRDDGNCRKILEEALPFSKEASAARAGDVSWSSAFRQISKRRQAIATASPFSVSIVGTGHSYFYRDGVLSYMVDDTLRILNLDRSDMTEMVISIWGLMRSVTDDSERCSRGRFCVLYHNENIIACLYTFSDPTLAKKLIAIDTRESRVLLTHDLPHADKVFVRLNRKFLYYGTYGHFGLDGYKCWALRGYKFEDRENENAAGWFDDKIVLHSLIGSNIGHTICFEIHRGYFYAVSNQTTREVEEIDWTSFYHAVRFPIDSPNKLLIEKSEDELMWRRQHLEGPIDDRWTNMRLDVDEATGNLNIIELRNEWLSGGSRSRRTFYRKEVIFRQMSMDQILHSAILSSSKAPSMISTLLTSLSSTASISSKSSVSPVCSASQVLSDLTKDRLALTVTQNDNPHFLPPQTRLPRDVHSAHESHILFSKVRLTHYNPQANSYIDLINDPKACTPMTQRLRLCVGSRRLLPIRRTETGELLIESVDPRTGKVMEGLNETFTENLVTSWPPDRGTELEELMNPQGHIGDVQATADDRFLIYATGKREQSKALVLVSFDPAVKLKGLRKWKSPRAEGTAAQVERRENRGSHDAEALDLQGQGPSGRENLIADAKRSIEPAVPGRRESRCEGPTQSWMWREPAMYLAINRGYDFSYPRR